LAFQVFPSLKEWEMPKLKGKKKEGELVRLPYYYKFKKYFKTPCQEWLETIEAMCNEILGNYSKKEDQLMTAAFGTRPKQRLNRVLDALGFEYPDYENLNKGVGGQKRKRITEALNEGEKEPLKKKNPKKRKTSSPKQQISEAEETPASPSAAVVEEILKVMTESLPTKLSPLGLQLTKFFQKDKEPEKSKKTIKAKKQRIVTVTEVIDKTPPRASAQKTPAAAEGTDIEIAPSEAAAAEAAEAGSAEDLNLESTIEHIDQILLDMAAEEATTAAEEAVTAASKKGKEIADEASENEAFMFQNLVGEHLSKAEIEELREYAKSCGYKPGALLFGGVDDEKLECIRNQTGAKVISTLSKSIGFPKLETDISRYRRQHVVGSLFYSNFKVNNLSLNFYCLE
jgi:hypothetical protein